MAADKDEDAELGLTVCSALPDSAISTVALLKTHLMRMKDTDMSEQVQTAGSSEGTPCISRPQVLPSSMLMHPSQLHPLQFPNEERIKHTRPTILLLRRGSLHQDTWHCVFGRAESRISTLWRHMAIFLCFEIFKGHSLGRI